VISNLKLFQKDFYYTTGAAMYLTIQIYFVKMILKINLQISTQHPNSPLGAGGCTLHLHP
jgi:hypothetical protein